METIKAIAKRSSVRAYKPEQISEDALNFILSAGCAAPVGMKKYDSLHITVIQDKEILGRISSIVRQMMKTDNDPLYGVPALILLSSAEAPAPGLDYVNAACVIENMLLAAADRGIGSVIVWASALAVEADAELKAALKLPEGFKAVLGAGFGYSVSAQKEKELKATFGINRI